MDEAAVNMFYRDGVTAEISNTNCISTAKLRTLIFTVLFLLHSPMQDTVFHLAC